MIILFLYYSFNCQQNSLIRQIEKFFRQIERISLHLILPCVLLMWFHEIKITLQTVFFACQKVQRKVNGTTSSTTRMLMFWQRKEIVLRELSDRNYLEFGIYLYNKYSLISSLVITLTFHYTLYLVQYKRSRRLQKKKR